MTKFDTVYYNIIFESGQGTESTEGTEGTEATKSSTKKKSLKQIKINTLDLIKNAIKNGKLDEEYENLVTDKAELDKFKALSQQEKIKTLITTIINAQTDISEKDKKNAIKNITNVIWYDSDVSKTFKGIRKKYAEDNKGSKIVKYGLPIEGLMVAPGTTLGVAAGGAALYGAVKLGQKFIQHLVENDPAAAAACRNVKDKIKEKGKEKGVKLAKKSWDFLKDQAKKYSTQYKAWKKKQVKEYIQLLKWPKTRQKGLDKLEQLAKEGNYLSCLVLVNIYHKNSIKDLKETIKEAFDEEWKEIEDMEKVKIFKNFHPNNKDLLTKRNFYDKLIANLNILANKTNKIQEIILKGEDSVEGLDEALSSSKSDIESSSSTEIDDTKKKLVDIGDDDVTLPKDIFSNLIKFLKNPKSVSEEDKEALRELEDYCVG